MNIYLNNESFIAGMTLKDESKREQNNMAFHVAKTKESVLENRSLFASLIGVELGDFVCANQTHSAHFHKVILADKGKGAYSTTNAIPNTDALYTFESNVVLCSFTADCVPVIFYNEKSGVVGVIHSGWQGTVKEITRHVFQHLINVDNCNPKYFKVYIGSALSQEKFEVDRDVFVKFQQLGYADEFMFYRSETGKYHIDNQKTVKKQCELVGIPSDCIKIDPTCTYMSETGFSYREDKQTGRHLSFIVKKG